MQHKNRRIFLTNITTKVFGSTGGQFVVSVDHCNNIKLFHRVGHNTKIKGQIAVYLSVNSALYSLFAWSMKMLSRLNAVAILGVIGGGSAFSVSTQLRQPLTVRPIGQQTSLTRVFVTEKPSTGVPTSSAVEEVRADAQDALSAVGWSLPAEGELTADDPFVQAIDAGIRRDVGVPLDELLNPAKVVNLERDLYVKRLELAELTQKDITQADFISNSNSGQAITTADYDGGGGGEEADQLRKAIAKKEADLLIERRAVFRGWLKNVFLIQAILSFALSYVMATNPYALFGGFSWYEYYNMDISISVLGYWWWWLFVVPSLRSRRPKGAEKKALDLCFLATPAVSLVAPVFTKDTGVIWTANLAVVVASYAYAFLLDGDADESDDDGSSQQPVWLKFIYKSLDFGSGRERGARK
jgi:hypothetical protein